MKNILPDFHPVTSGVAAIPFRSPWLLTIVSALLATFLLPQQAPFAYRYAVGLPWSYRTLTAPFDFEVLYPEEQRKNDLDKVASEHGPYLLANPASPRDGKQKLAELLTEQTRVSRHDPQFADLVANPGAYEAYGARLLDDIYARGIVAPETEVFLREQAGRYVYVVEGNDIRQTKLADLLTLEKARDVLSDSLPYSQLRQPEMLLPLLEKTLYPNLTFSDSLTRAALRQKRASVLSTGIVVRKGEVIVSHNDLITPEAAQKLDSLARRYEQPGGWQKLAAYFILSLLLFGAFFMALWQRAPEVFDFKEKLWLLPALSLSAVLLVNLTQQFAAAAPLMLPLAGLPLVLSRYPRPVGLALWVVVILLTGFALDWGIAWIMIQTAGLLVVLLLPAAKNWQGALITSLVLSITGGLAWLAACWAGRLPQPLQSPDVLLFLLLAAALTSVSVWVKWGRTD